MTDTTVVHARKSASSQKHAVEGNVWTPTSIRGIVGSVTIGVK